MGKREIRKMVTREETEQILTCDTCGKDVTVPYNSCPTQIPLLRVFVGYDSTRPSPYGYNSDQPIGTKYGVDMGEMCKECRESWFDDLLNKYPHAKKVKIND